MSETNRENITRENLINELIDVFNIREPIEAYQSWLEMPLEDLLLIRTIETDKYTDEDYFYE